MRKGIVMNVSSAVRARLEAIVADGLGRTEIVRRTGNARSVIWRRQERFMHARADSMRKNQEAARRALRRCRRRPSTAWSL